MDFFCFRTRALDAFRRQYTMTGTVAAEVTAASGLMSASSVFYFLLVPALALWLVYWKLSRQHMNKLAERIPGPVGLPIIGNLMDLLGSSHSKFFNLLPISKSLYYKKLKLKKLYLLKRVSFSSSHTLSKFFFFMKYYCGRIICQTICFA